MKLEEFKRWFNKGFWKAFESKGFPIYIPKTREDRAELIKNVHSSIFSARYSASIPEAEFIMNKGYGVARTVPIFCIEDYCVYYFCIKELEDVLCKKRTPNTFGGWSLGGEFRRKEHREIECEASDYGRYSFNPLAWVQAFGEFNSILFAQLDKEHYSHILQFDLSNFYDSVRLDILERWIREESPQEKGWVITLLFYLLNNWNRRNTGLHPQSVGIPQDALADCSRILANYYLHLYDDFAYTICSKIGAQYFRYSDDQMILLNDKSKVDILLLLLTRKLDRFNLRVNQKKVQIWTSDQLKLHRYREIHEILPCKDSKNNPELVKQFVNAYLSIPVTDLEKSWNSGTPLLNKLLWLNFELMQESQANEIFHRLISERFILMADHKKLKRIYELNQLRKKPINFIQFLIDLGDSTVHNSFHYAVLAFSSSINDLDLKAHFENRLEQLYIHIEKCEIY
jgi:hypothetical protein